MSDPAASHAALSDKVWDLVPDGATVFVSGSCGTPVAVVESMAQNHDRWHDIRVVTPYLYEPLALFEHAGRPFRFVSLHPTPVLRDLEPSAVELRPLPFSAYMSVFGRGLDVDVALVQVTPPGADGRVSLGPSVGSVLGAVESARLVIAQANPAVPYVFGDGELTPDERWHVVDAESELVEAPTGASTPALTAMGRAAAALVEDGSTVQFGVGAAPAAVAAALSEHRGLRLHGGLCTPELAALIDGGVIIGTAVAAELAGDRALFGWADRNPSLHLVAAARSHGAAALAAHERFVAINSVIEVALDGSANAEHLSGRRVSGPGGLPDYVTAALRSPAGRSLVALPSTARDVSRIVARLAGGTTTLPAWSADTVVTEHGVAELRHRSLRDRGDALIAVADPRFRSELADRPDR